MEVRGQIWRDAMKMGGLRAEVLKGPGAWLRPLFTPHSSAACGMRGGRLMKPSGYFTGFFRGYANMCLVWRRVSSAVEFLYCGKDVWSEQR